MNWYNNIQYKDFQNAEAQIKPDDKIHMSSDLNIYFIDVSSKQSIENKPRGLWYACGNEWIKFARNIDMGTGDYFKQHLFKININPSTMLMIRDNNAMNEFEDIYGAGYKERFPELEEDELVKHNVAFINWPEVAKKYSGIEICPWLGTWRKNPHSTWYYGWDVASGCIWRENAIMNIERLI